MIWHIPGKIEAVETVCVKTAAQVRYKSIIRRLTVWLQEVLGTSFVKPTAMSSLKFSQKGTISQISWISPYDRLDENGRLETLPEDTPVEDLSFQFVTASEDGTVAFWDPKLVNCSFVDFFSFLSRHPLSISLTVCRKVGKVSRRKSTFTEEEDESRATGSTEDRLAVQASGSHLQATLPTSDPASPRKSTTGCYLAQHSPAEIQESTNGHFIGYT